MQKWFVVHYEVLKDFGGQGLTAIGFVITIIFAIVGLKTFKKWKREALEERRIETALDALSLSYESKYVFDHIRAPMSYEYEWKDMPKKPGESEQERDRRGPFYAPLNRIKNSKEFFDRSWKLHPRVMALFGHQADEIFRKLHEARRDIEVASEMLMWETGNLRQQGGEDEHWKQMKADIWPPYAKFTKEGDVVGKKLTQFRDGIEQLCRPVVDRGYRG